jgi:hypothetical protein
MTTTEHSQLRQIGWLARIALALVFFWHGLVPKLLWLSADEIAMIQAHGIVAAEWLAALAGFAEIALALLLLSIRRHWPLQLAALLLLLLLLDVALFSPHLLLQAFNPVSTNLAALALCLVAWLAESTPAGRASPE